MISTIIYGNNSVMKMAKETGFTATKSLFWFAIRNPVYCGKIFIPKYKEEERQFVKGVHEPIISEVLYYQVQDVLDGRKRSTYKPKILTNENLPLRGFLICPKCGKLLTGSTSKGHTKYYTYYHCTTGCTCRFNADTVNKEFVYELKKFIPRPEVEDLYKITLTEAWYDQTSHVQDDRVQILEQIRELESRLSNARDLVASKQIDPADFNAQLNVSSGQVLNSEANLKQRQQDLDRQSELYKNHVVAQQDFQNAQDNFSAAQAQLISAKANLELARLNLSYTKVFAPVNGYVTNMNTSEGT